LLRFDVVANGARVREAIVAILQRRHLPERARLAEVGIGIADATRLQLEVDAFLGCERDDLANKGRQGASEQDHGRTASWRGSSGGYRVPPYRLSRHSTGESPCAATAARMKAGTTCGIRRSGTGAWVTTSRRIRPTHVRPKWARTPARQGRRATERTANAQTTR